MTTSALGFDRRDLCVLLAGFSAFLDLYATQGMLPCLGREFAVSPLTASATVSATTTVVALSAPFAGLLADRFGRRRLIVTSALLLALPTLLAGTSASLGWLLLWRAAQGVLDVMARDGGPHPNIDFALGVLGEATRMVHGAGETIFAVARSAGWIAHGMEEYPHRLRYRIRATYTGPDVEADGGN